MIYQGRAQRVLIYIGEDNRFGNKPLYMAVLEYLRANDALGATVTRGIAGFGAHSRIHTAAVLALSTDLPIRIEWVDVPTRRPPDARDSRHGGRRAHHGRGG